MAPPLIRLCQDLRSAAAVSRSLDVIFEILSWLPAKLLCRCRIVSREWRAITSDPPFIAMHRSRAEPLLVGMSSSVCGTTLQLMDTDGTVVQRFPRREGRWTLHASLGDLACISSNPSGRERCRTLVVDLSTGNALVPCLKPGEDAPVGVLMYFSCLAELNGTLCMARKVQPFVADIWLLTDADNNFWIKAYSLPVDLSADFVVPLRLLRLGGELLFYSSYQYRSTLMLQVYDPRSGKCTHVKTSTNLIGRIGLCSSNLDPRLCVQS